LVLAFGFLTSMVAPRWVSFPSRFLNPLRIVIVVGLLATQSRGAMLATVAVLAVLQLRSRHSRRGVALVIVATLAMGGVTLAVTQVQNKGYKANPGSAQFSGLGARVVTYKQALTIWSSDKLLGAGLRYFRVLSFNTTEPHDVAIEALAESGVVGVAALLVLLTGAWLALRRMDGELATLARCALWLHFLASLFDIYWVAGRTSFAWIVVGMAIGAQGLERTRVQRPAVATVETHGIGRAARATI
jgi:O-antigen ligase